MRIGRDEDERLACGEQVVGQEQAPIGHNDGTRDGTKARPDGAHGQVTIAASALPSIQLYSAARKQDPGVGAAKGEHHQRCYTCNPPQARCCPRQAEGTDPHHLWITRRGAVAALQRPAGQSRRLQVGPIPTSASAHSPPPLHCRASAGPRSDARPSPRSHAKLAGRHTRQRTRPCKGWWQVSMAPPTAH